MKLNKRGLTAVLFGKRPQPIQASDDRLDEGMVRAEVQNLQAQAARTSAAARLHDTLGELLGFQQQGKGSSVHVSTR